MRYIGIVLLVVMASVSVFAQATDKVEIPRTLSAGTLMSARTAATTYDDTTQAVSVRGYDKVILTLQVAANDTANLLVQVQPSFDGVTFDATFDTIDSLVNTTSAVLPQQGFELPDKYLGFQAVRFRVKGQAWGLYAGSPVATVTTRIIRKSGKQ